MIMLDPSAQGHAALSVQQAEAATISLVA